MTNKILVTYASRAGSTVGVAEAIARTLSENGLDVDLRPMQEVYDLTPYTAVVAGSAIQQDNWLPEAMSFLQRHQAELSQKPFAPFLVCMALAVTTVDKREQTIQSVSKYLQPVRNMVQPVSEGMFAGALNISKISSFGWRMFARFGVLIGFWAEGDYRDWDAIRAWANTLPPKLTA